VVRRGSRCSTLSQSGVAEDLAAALQSDFVNSRDTGCAGWAKGLKAMQGCGRVRPVTWSTAGLDYTYAIIR
jgi:hypothetical protein